MKNIGKIVRPLSLITILCGCKTGSSDSEDGSNIAAANKNSNPFGITILPSTPSYTCRRFDQSSSDVRIHFTRIEILDPGSPPNSITDPLTPDVHPVTPSFEARYKVEVVQTRPKAFHESYVALAHDDTNATHHVGSFLTTIQDEISYKAMVAGNTSLKRPFFSILIDSQPGCQGSNFPSGETCNNLDVEAHVNSKAPTPDDPNAITIESGDFGGVKGICN